MLIVYVDWNFVIYVNKKRKWFLTRLGPYAGFFAVNWKLRFTSNSISRSGIGLVPNILVNFFDAISLKHTFCDTRASMISLTSAWILTITWLTEAWLPPAWSILTSWSVSRDMTKPTKWLCAQRRLRSAWASAQFDQSLRLCSVGS